MSANYLESVAKGEEKINTKGLFCYEIVRKALITKNIDKELLDLMWNNQNDFLKGTDKNILVVADTSGSMTRCGYLPLATSIGLAIYIAERNNGIFKNYFITFSDSPFLCEIKGNTIVDKIKNIKAIFGSTDIDKVFELLLTTCVDNHLAQEEMPSHIILISDMEFDSGTLTRNGTNFDGWKQSFLENGYKLPTIIFWNVAAFTQGVPVTKYDKDVVLISGFSTNALENILDLPEYTMMDGMIETLTKYIEMLEE